jgi:hypothetical protein
VESMALFLGRHHRLLGSLAMLCLILFYSADGHARMGGGGGGDDGGGGDGGGDGIADLIFLILYMLPFPLNVVVAALVLAAFFWYARMKQQGSILNEMPGVKLQPTRDDRGILAFSQTHPDFDEAAFLAKANKAFLDIQSAWSDMDIARVRRYLTDGMYQRVNTQFAMMRLLDQKNSIESLEIKSIFIDRVEGDDLHDVIHVGVFACIQDHFVSGTYPNLNRNLYEEFVEYWSFIRKTTASGKDLYHTTGCPSCGGEIGSNLGELSRCPYCGTITNAGDHDWVLAKITQVDDYRIHSRLHDLSQSLVNKIDEISGDDPDFSVLKLEDKASNGFLQLETARILKDPKLVRRFVTDDYLERFSRKISQEPDFVYNRIYLNDVTIIGAMQQGYRNFLALSVKYSAQRVRLEGSEALWIDPAVTSRSEVVLMTRDAASHANLGSVYTHQCPTCAGTVGDTIDLNCPYCGNPLNSTKNEWIIADVMSQTDYQEFSERNRQFFIANVPPAKLQSLMKVRDYALNNVLVMIAADGVFTDTEMAFARKLARGWGYAPARLEGLFQLASNRQLKFRIPERPKDREKVYRMMCKAASSDGAIAPEESVILHFYRQQAGLPER